MVQVAKYCCLLLLSATCASNPAFAQTFDNTSVVALHNAGLGNDAIVAKVRSLPCNYETSTERLIALKHAGISDEIIVAMVERCAGAARAQGVNDEGANPMAAHSPGIYSDQSGEGGHKLILLRPALSSSVKFTGNGSILFPRLAKLIVPQPSAQLTLSRRPSFWFYFNAADRKVSSFGTVSTTAAQSPGEFSLVRFRQDGGNRQFVVGRAQPFEQILGVDPKNTISFLANEVGDSVFKVEISSDLTIGEYAFVLAGEKATFRIYDFSVK